MDAQSSSVAVSEQVEEALAHVEQVVAQVEELPAHVDMEAANDGVADELPAHSLMSVLMPATPPEPKNARIVRLFDLEAAKYDPQPGQPVEPQSPRQKQQKSRTALREERSRSLLAAARYTF
jgi:hypothetical protein